MHHDISSAVCTRRALARVPFSSVLPAIKRSCAKQRFAFHTQQIQGNQTRTIRFGFAHLKEPPRQENNEELTDSLKKHVFLSGGQLVRSRSECVSVRGSKCALQDSSNVLRVIRLVHIVLICWCMAVKWILTEWMSVVIFGVPCILSNWI